MKDIFYKLLILSVFGFGYTLSAQQKVSKTIKQSYEFTNSGELQLDNKYGNITINGWNQQEIEITIDILVNKKEKADAKDLLDRIKPSITSSGGLVNIFSNIEEKSSGFFSRMLSKTNPLDVGKGNIQINYTINLPINSKIQVTNKFGDIIINDWNGKLKLNLQHGDTWINNDITNANIKMKFGKLRTKSITNGNVELKNSEFDLENSKDLKINSSGSTITIKNVAELEVYSNKDKVTIEKLKTITGELKFSNVKLLQVQQAINITMEVADLQIKKISKSDTNIIVNQKSSEVNINISGLNFDFNASLEQGLLRIPKSFKNIKNTMINRIKRLRNIEASYGSENNKGKINIKGEKGIIILQER
ncbi:hypothetical protein [Aquimarina sp. 2201CG14-23]|uniref:hypothetical protein n=1 Tax=Aquimarina mycalae TaxID=3040073 RepID=UPI002478003A|nr:hypothetical protein [Aquimarina sp. 2201CG14-23]MDH7448233.1 hypothetical protein [Aquimarina sp. 2201CG14-23]